MELKNKYGITQDSIKKLLILKIHAQNIIMENSQLLNISLYLEGLAPILKENIKQACLD